MRRGAAAWWLAAAAIGLALFVADWLFRFNDPGGSFAGLTDDHFFYLVRGWQILFGDLPVRDFVDHGAPLFYYVGAAVQWIGGRGTLSEILFCTTVLAAAAAVVYWLAVEASGSLVFGLAGALVHVLLEPRFYNYPKIVVYAAAIPALWAFADRPTRGRTALLAVITVVGFLFRHDHGVFVAAAMAVLLLALTGLPWRERLRHAIVYAALTAALASPYLLFIQLNGSVVSYISQASAWAERDRDRAPVVWPGLADNPDGVSPAAASGGPIARRVAAMRDNSVAWIFYLEIALPLLALAVLALSPNGFRPEWPRAAPKLLMVAVLGLLLDIGFLRSPLEARLADPSVPHAVLIAWLGTAVARLVTARAAVLRPALARRAPLVAAAVIAAVAIFGGLLAVAVTGGVYDRLDKAGLTERFGKPFDRAEGMYASLRSTWPLERTFSRDQPNVMRLAFYLRDCTRPTDRVFMQLYLPQVLALSQRAFAGGHADLRPGFFNTPDAQRLTLARLERQSVPVVVLATGPDYLQFRRSFPLITAYFDREYVLAGERALDERFSVRLLVSRAAVPTRRYEPLDWPCFR